MKVSEAKQKLQWFIAYLDTCPAEWYTDVVVKIEDEDGGWTQCSLEDFYIHVSPTSSGFKVFIENTISEKL